MELTLEKIFTIFLSLAISVALIIPTYNVTVSYFVIMKNEIDINNFINTTNKSISTVYRTQNNISEIKVFYPGNITMEVKNNTLIFSLVVDNRTQMISLVYPIKIKIIQSPTVRGFYFLSVFFINNSNQNEKYISLLYEYSE